MSSPEPSTSPAIVEPTKRDEMSVEQVQRWVITVLVFAITSFPIGGLVAVSHSVHGQEDRRGSAIGLMIMAGVIGVLAVGAMRMIHKRSVATPLLILGVLPAAVASYFIF
ncbi:MAG: hypothetical protein ABIR57_00525 [Aeromicrobium sp.]